MFKLNQFGFPVFELYDPKKAEEITKTGQEALSKMMDPALFFKLTGNPFEPEYVEDKNLEKGDVVDFLDAEGCYVCKCTIIGVREDLAYVQLEITNSKPMTVRRSDLLKLVKNEKRFL